MLDRLNRIEAAHVVNGNYLRIRRAFEDLLTDVEAATAADAQPTPEGRALVITAPSFCGKSHVLDRLVLDGRLVPFEDYGVQRRPFLWVRAPSPCNLKTLGLAFLKALGATLGRNLTDTYLIWHAVRCQLLAQGVLVVLIDEFHNVLVGKNRDELDKLSAALKALVVGETIVLPPDTAPASFVTPVTERERTPVFLVLAGTEKVGAFASDFSTEDREQFARRCTQAPFEEIPIRRNQVDGGLQFTGLKEFLQRLSDEMGVPLAPDLLSDNGLARVHKAGSRQMGRAALLLKDGARLSVRRNQPEVTTRHLAQAFEDLYKTGPLRNCFLVVDIDNCAYPPSPRAKDGRAKEIA
jgi:hypothetical protein